MSFSFERNDLGSCSSSPIGRNSDVSCESSSDGEDSTEVEVQSQLKGPLDTMDALEDVLPTRRGISKFYNGKSKSFASLADAATVSSVKDFAKPDNFYNKKRKNLLVHSSLSDKNDNNNSRNSGNELPKRVANSNGSSDFNSNSSSPCSYLPPLHPQCKRSPMIGSSSSTTAHQPNMKPPCRSFSLSDLQFAAAVAGTTSNVPGFAVHSGNKDNKMGWIG